MLWVAVGALVASAPGVQAEEGKQRYTSRTTPHVTCVTRHAQNAKPTSRCRTVAPWSIPLHHGAPRCDGCYHPETGLTPFEYGMSGKWLDLLKQIAPGMTRAAVLRDPSITAGVGQFAAIQSVAPLLGVELRPVDVRDADEIERAVAAFALRSHGGLIVTLTGLTIRHRDLISTLAAPHRLPAVYPYRYFVTSGGLISYGPNPIDEYRQASGYVDRILKGEKPADLPVQNPNKYELLINLKTAKALGLEVPPTLLARADEVIE